MDSAEKDLYYQKINELLLDEEKIITCTSLASSLEISINDAKTLLTEFVQDLRQMKHADVYATFIITGRLKDTKGLAVYFVKEEELNEKRTLYDSVYTELTYSIQKSKNVDLSIVALGDRNTMESCPGLIGSIVGKNCVRRNISRTKILQPTDVEEGKECSSFFKKVISKNGINSSKMDDQQSSKELQQPKQQSKGKQTGGIANYFTKGSVIASKNGINTSSSSKNFFSNTEETREKIKSVNNEKDNSKTETMHADTSSPEHSQALTKKRKKPSKADNGVNKKRKRIQEICDSDSDIFDEEKVEDIIENSDRESEETPAIEVPAKKRIRKAIDEVHMDEEGFLVTTTKYIYESGSEDEKGGNGGSTEDKPKVLAEKKNSASNLDCGTKKQPSKGNKSKKATTGKQTTLINFFKKK